MRKPCAQDGYEKDVNSWIGQYYDIFTSSPSAVGHNCTCILLCYSHGPKFLPIALLEAGKICRNYLSWQYRNDDLLNRTGP